MAFNVGLFFERFWDIVVGPFKNPEMIWIVIPLLITLLIIEMYFMRYKNERLGWNTALSNTLVLVFVSLNLFQRVFIETRGSLFKATNSTGFLIAFVILALGILLFLVDFFHLVPEGVAFIISAHLPINITDYTAIVIVYSHIPLDLLTILSWLFMIIILGGLFFLLRLLHRK